MKDATKWTMGAYVIDLPVTTEIARPCRGTRDLELPEVRHGDNGRSQGEALPKTPSTTLDLHEPTMTLERMGLPGRDPAFEGVVHLPHHAWGRPLRTLTDVDARFKAILASQDASRVNERSRHVMAGNIMDMGLMTEKPCRLHCEKARMILHGGTALA